MRRGVGGLVQIGRVGWTNGMAQSQPLSSAGSEGGTGACGSAVIGAAQDGVARPMGALL